MYISIYGSNENFFLSRRLFCLITKVLFYSSCLFFILHICWYLHHGYICLFRQQYYSVRC